MTPVKLSIYSGYDSKTAAYPSASWSNMNFASIADAKKYCLYYGSNGDSRYIKYFFHVNGENIDVWFTVNFVKPDRGRTLKPKLVEVYAPVIGCSEINKQHKIKEAKKRIKEWQAWLERLQKDNKERIDIIQCEKKSAQIGEQQLHDMRNKACSPTPYTPCPPPIDRSPEPGSLLEGYYHWRSTTPNVDYKGPYVTIEMGSCGSGRYDPNTGKYNPHWHGG